MVLENFLFCVQASDSYLGIFPFFFRFPSFLCLATSRCASGRSSAFFFLSNPFDAFSLKRPGPPYRRSPISLSWFPFCLSRFFQIPLPVSPAPAGSFDTPF